MRLFSLLIPCIFIFSCWSRTAEEWKTRTLYQIVTDRFATSDGSTPECTDLLNYCGGTFKGIERNLDYIQGMGFNAIWISPTIENSEGGYHGYWYKNFYGINNNFGTEQDFHDLVKACHDRDIWVMVDVVPNHVTPVPNNTDFSQIVPFNDAKYYHHPILPCRWVFDNQPDNHTALELCWLWGLPDLDHENEEVSKMLLDWIHDFVQTYKIDGLRADAVRHVPKWFWTEFTKAAGVFVIGEVFKAETDFVAEYQGPLDSLLNFPLQDRLYKAFHEGESMDGLKEYYSDANKIWPDITVIGNFIDNHDIPRYLFENDDIPGLKASYAFAFCSVGIPSCYYGDEQAFNGGIDPANRETLWGHMDTNSDMYQFFKSLNGFRKDTGFYNFEQIERLADQSFYSFSRGLYFFAFTNSKEIQTRVISSHPYSENMRLCNAFDQKDCVEVKNGEFSVTLNDKEFKILFPVAGDDENKNGVSYEKLFEAIWKNEGVTDMSKMYSFYPLNKN